MSAFAANFHFLRPWWLLALLALPLLWRMFAQRGSDAGAWTAAVDPHLLRHLLVRGDDSAPRRWPLLAVLVGWLLGCIALAGPAWEQLPQPLYKNRAARIFALELSASMYAQDEKPSRFERARFKLKDMLARSADMQTALIAYAGDAFVVAPLTDDANTVTNLVDALDPGVMPVGGNATGHALDLAVKLAQQGGAVGAEIVLLADGASDDAVAAAVRARAGGMHVSVLAFGTAQGAPVPLPQGGFLKNANGEIVLPKLDVPRLAELASAGTGSYLDAADGAAFDAWLKAPANTAIASKTSEASTARFLDRGPWLLLLLVPLAATGFRRGWVMLLLLGTFVRSEPVHAFEWTDLWQRADQQARQQLEAGHPQQAQALAQSPDLRGAAAYRGGDFAGAERDFERAASNAANADAHYNRGNALAKQGRYEQALAAYGDALKLAPGMEDAAANKRAIEEWMRQQQQQSDQSQQQAQDHQGHEQKQAGDGKPSSQQGEQQDQQKNQQAKDGEASPGNPAQQQAASPGKDQQQPTDAPSPGDQAEQQAQEKFSKSMDQAMQENARTGDKKPQPIRLGANDDGKQQDERDQAVQQWIERVPDDPGGLLRRKFQIEYQRRQNQADPRGGGR